MINLAKVGALFFGLLGMTVEVGFGGASCVGGAIVDCRSMPKLAIGA